MSFVNNLNSLLKVLSSFYGSSFELTQSEGLIRKQFVKDEKMSGGIPIDTIVQITKKIEALSYQIQNKHD